MPFVLCLLAREVHLCGVNVQLWKEIESCLLQIRLCVWEKIDLSCYFLLSSWIFSASRDLTRQRRGEARVFETPSSAVLQDRRRFVDPRCVDACMRACISIYIYNQDELLGMRRINCNRLDEHYTTIPSWEKKWIANRGLLLFYLSRRRGLLMVYEERKEKEGWAMWCVCACIRDKQQIRDRQHSWVWFVFVYRWFVKFVERSVYEQEKHSVGPPHSQSTLREREKEERRRVLSLLLSCIIFTVTYTPPSTATSSLTRLLRKATSSRRTQTDRVK